MCVCLSQYSVASVVYDFVSFGHVGVASLCIRALYINHCGEPVALEIEISCCDTDAIFSDIFLFRKEIRLDTIVCPIVSALLEIQDAKKLREGSKV